MMKHLAEIILQTQHRGAELSPWPEENQRNYFNDQQVYLYMNMQIMTHATVCATTKDFKYDSSTEAIFHT